MKFLALNLFALAFALNVHADILTTTLGKKELAHVVISESGVASVDRRSTELTTVGAGIRWKNVLVAKPNIYVLELLADDPTKFVADYEKIQESVNAMSVVALKLSFVRSLEAKTIAESFDTALDNNGVDVSQEEYKTLHDAIAGGEDATKGTTFSVVLEKISEEADMITVQNSSSEPVSVTGKRGFFEGFLSIWLGNTTKDKGLDSVKKQLSGTPL